MDYLTSMNLQSLFEQAVTHQQEHNCSAHPYENYQKLSDIITTYRPEKILEIGTGIGFTAVVMALASPQAMLDTIEKDVEHANFAQQFIKSQNLNQRIIIHNAVAEEFLPTLSVSYDLIFFDGYQIHYEFLPHYQRLLSSGGILIVGNNHLNSKTSDRFFTELKDEECWQSLAKFADTIVYKKVSL